ncbi:uncharacterized protein LOC143265883 isoform X2 [Megachile rotundata]|uniref:uncharacterized protein LOC143265883 isoform X2 n=1 Tax=Megachile rotundata TaxID=143995 RepID=UPI003FD4A5BF
MAAVEDEIIDTAVESVQPINGRFLHLGVHFWLTDLSQCLHFRIPPGPTKTPGRRVTTPTGPGEVVPSSAPKTSPIIHIFPYSTHPPTYFDPALLYHNPHVLFFNIHTGCPSTILIIFTKSYLSIVRFNFFFHRQ